MLARFHFALQRSGYLFLGKAETLLSHSVAAWAAPGSATAPVLQE